ncbi:MAG: DUF6614 family protein, partial [Pseudomonadota bacterium]
MSGQTIMGCSMFGAFNLKDDTDIESFGQAYNAFCKHLKAKGYLVSWRLFERAFHDGYDANCPSSRILIEMKFHDHQA